MDQVQEREAELVVISDDAEALGRGARARWPCRRACPSGSRPLSAIGVGQLFAMELAVARDLNPDEPRALRKVTETR